MNGKKVLVAAGISVGLLSSIVVPAAMARDYIAVVGSSTVYPFSTVVAEQFGKSTHFKTPKIESTGTGGGFKLFCGGIGNEYPDISNASRRVKASEVKRCTENGVAEIIEVKIGYDGIVLANSNKAASMKLTLKDIFLALAKEVPDPTAEGRLIPNPYKSWKAVNPALPNTKIEVLGPPPTSGTRDAFVELAMEGGAKQFSWLKKMKKSDKKQFKKIAHTLREDGHFVEAGENDNLIVQKLTVNPTALGLFGFSFLDQNLDKVQGSLVEGHAPEFEAIGAGDYPISRPLYFYVKKGHLKLVPGVKEFLQEFTRARAWGEEGYLADKGMIPMSDDERHVFQQNVEQLRALKL